MSLISAYSLNQADWIDLFHAKGLSPNTLPYWLDGLYKNRTIWENHISAGVLDDFQTTLDLKLPEISSIQESSDGTTKFLIRFHDQMEVETVLIPFHKRFTVCLSTQVGCGMNCSFCYTGTQGLKRNLTSGEIVSQYILAKNWLLQKRPSIPSPSIVFMGQGEPLHNLTEVKKAISIFNDRTILGVGIRQMTLSTVGFLPGLKALTSDFPKINFALSLHSPFQDERSALIPVNETFKLEEVINELDKLPLLSRQFVTYEYLLIKDFNMSDDHVHALGKLLKNRKAILNLIPFNPFPGSKWERPDKNAVEEFKNKLVAQKLRVMIRTTKGSDILAACGQLKVNKLARKNG